MDTPVLIKALNKDLGAELEENSSPEVLYKELLLIIEDLINNNFSKLVLLLYRVDVSETKLKAILKKNDGVNASQVITNLIIERQYQKIESRKAFGSKPGFSEETW